MGLPFLCKKSGTIALMLLGLMAGWLAGWQTKFRFFKPGAHRPKAGVRLVS